MSRPLLRDLSQAHRDHETEVADTHSATLLVELAAESTVLTVSPTIAEHINRSTGDLFKAYRVLVLTEDEHEALAHAVCHARENGRELRRRYDAGHGEVVQPCARSSP